MSSASPRAAAASFASCYSALRPEDDDILTDAIAVVSG